MNRREFLRLCGVFGASLLARLSPPKKKRQFDEIADIGVTDKSLYMMGYEDGACWIVKSDDGGIIFHEACQFPLASDSRPTSMAILECIWYVGCDNGDLWTSEDEGQTWNQEQYEIQGGMDAVAWAGDSADSVEVWP